jgi:DNA-binding Xre family transcriptional regulator
MITYKIDVYNKLKEKGYNTTKIRDEKILSESSLQKIRKGEIIGINALDKVCRLLEMQPGNIIKYEKDER